MEMKTHSCMSHVLSLHLLHIIAFRYRKILQCWSLKFVWELHSTSKMPSGLWENQIVFTFLSGRSWSEALSAGFGSFKIIWIWLRFQHVYQSSPKCTYSDTHRQHEQCGCFTSSGSATLRVRVNAQASMVLLPGIPKYGQDVNCSLCVWHQRSLLLSTKPSFHRGSFCEVGKPLLRTDIQVPPKYKNPPVWSVCSVCPLFSWWAATS